MPLPKIAAVATATPPHRFSQEALLALAGYDDPRPVPAQVVRDVLATAGPAREHLTGAVLSLSADLTVPPYGAWWLTEAG